tara:strand:+ start:32 stop:727 length:696 start_codon:yes stop_codon:yes gene_type:complete
MALSEDMKVHIQSWEKIHASRPWGIHPSEDLVRFVTRQYGRKINRPELHVIDIGCGPGANLTYLAREGFKLAGIDASATAIETIRKRFKKLNLPTNREKLDIRQGNFSKLPWGNNYFDLAIDIEAIYANPMEVIRNSINEARRVIKPGGAFFGKMFGTKTTGFNTGELYEPNTSRNPTCGPCGGFGFAHFFTREEIELVFSDFSSLTIDWIHRSDKGETIVIFEWIITAVK